MLHKILSALAILTLTMSGHIYAQVVYNDDIQPIFNARCIACHGGTSGVFLISYQAVMNSVGEQYGRNIVVPNEPDQSPIVDKIGTSPTYGDRMPQGGPYLNDAQIDLIRQWIAEGALETPATNIAENTAVPQRFELMGNYPNPFNPSTNIVFTLPVDAGWSVTVYTSAGRFVMDKSGFSPAGSNTVSVSMGNLSSGMYYYIVEMRPNGSNPARLHGRMLLVR
jgi:hypothetical protein